MTISANGNHQTFDLLEDIRIIDFSHALAGPYCTLVFAEYGARVYKLEAPGGGDMGRGWGPPFAGDQASYFLGLNRGKYGISIDLKQPAGVEICRRLISKMDVLVENFRPGTMDRLGLGYEQLREEHPRLIYCSISGYGQYGPARDEAAMDLVVQCSSGLVSMTGTENGQLVRSGYSVADVTAGMFAVIGILMALRHRDRTGLGQLVDVSMFDTLISAMTSNFMNYLGSGIDPRPMGTAFATIVPYRVFDGQDRSFALAVGSEKLWSAFCDVIERPDLESHPDYAVNADRVANRQTLEPMLQEIFSRRPAADWISRLRDVGIPCSLVRTFSEVVEDPQSAVREMFPTLDHPTAGLHRVTGRPVKLSAIHGEITKSAPLLGQHTRQTLTDLLSLDPSTMDELMRKGVIHEATRR
ncbi:MAG: CoA transferase [Acidobacteriota bacterium]|nr:MAG: CoA transferase [Acidobacteriota bacterium]